MAQQKRGSLATVNMMVAFVAIGAFMYWLYVTARPTEVAVAEEEPTIDVVAVATFAANPMMYEGSTIQLGDVEVVDNIGSLAFFFALPGGGEYLARLTPAASAGGQLALPGDRGSITGTVRAMSDSIFSAWTEEGIFVGVLSTQRDRVGAVSSYFLTDTMALSGGAAVPDSAAPAGTP